MLEHGYARWSVRINRIKIIIPKKRFYDWFPNEYDVVPPYMGQPYLLTSCGVEIYNDTDYSNVNAIITLNKVFHRQENGVWHDRLDMYRLRDSIPAKTGKSYTTWECVGQVRSRYITEWLLTDPKPLLVKDDAIKLRDLVIATLVRKGQI